LGRDRQALRRRRADPTGRGLETVAIDGIDIFRLRHRSRRHLLAAPPLAEVSDDLRDDATDSENAPRRTRTFDPLIKSQISSASKIASNPPSDNDLDQSRRSCEVSRAAKCAAETPNDGELPSVIQAWPTLPEAVCARILGLVEGATVAGSGG